jgi:DHA2 family multidrug resistance protein
MPLWPIKSLTARRFIGGLAPGVAEDSTIKRLSGTVNRQAAIMAYNDVFWMMGILCVVGLPFLFLLGGRKRQPVPAPARPAVQRS